MFSTVCPTLQRILNFFSTLDYFFKSIFRFLKNYFSKTIFEKRDCITFPKQALASTLLIQNRSRNISVNIRFLKRGNSFFIKHFTSTYLNYILFGIRFCIFYRPLVLRPETASVLRIYFIALSRIFFVK